MTHLNPMLSCIHQLYSEKFEDVPYRQDGESISAIVTNYAKEIGCTPSNTQAAVTWALKTPEQRGILAAIRAGRTRADNLLFRQQLSLHRMEA